MHSAILAFLLFITAIRASSVESTFKTTCTVPNTTTHYVSSPDTRGTLDILWSSLFTIIACTLTVQHLNVPEQRDERDPGWHGDLKWKFKDTLRSLKWMLITVLAPELLIAKGWDDFAAARRTHGKLRRFAEEDKVPWTMTHTLLANMGGFVVRSQQYKRTVPILRGNDAKPDDCDAIEAIVPTMLPRNPADASIDLTDFAEATSTACDLSRIEEESSRLSTEAEAGVEPLPDTYHAIAKTIIILREANEPIKLPYITEDEINDKSKANPFIKAIAMTQILWMVVQVIVRTRRRLPMTQLEIAVMAFAVCAVLIYIFNWRKPKDIKTAFTLANFHGDIPNAIERHLRVGYGIEGRLSRQFSFGSAPKIVKVGAHIPNDIVHADDFPTHILAGLFFGSLIFGGIHLAAWNFHFPSRVELIVWRVASVWCTAFSILSAIFIGFSYVMVQIFVALYVICRLILLVEIFRTLFFLPADAFVATSASNIPHVG